MRFEFGHWTDAVLFNDGGGGGDGGGAAAAAAGADAGAAGAGAAAAAGGQSSSAAAPDGAAAAGSLYRPDGLPDHFMGANDKETMDKMSKALAGYRNQAADVPDKAEAYKDFGEVDATIKPFLDTITADPIMNRMTDYAKEKGIPKGVFQDLTKHYMSVAAELGMLEPPIDVAKEQEWLTPANAKHLPAPEQARARDQRMNENFAFVDQLVSKDGGKDGGLSKESADFAKMMLGDRAVGHEFIEFLRAKTGGGGTGPLLDQNGGVRGADPKTDIERRRQLPENTWGHEKFDRASYDQLQKDARAVHG